MSRPMPMPMPELSVKATGELIGWDEFEKWAETQNPRFYRAMRMCRMMPVAKEDAIKLALFLEMENGMNFEDLVTKNFASGVWEIGI